MKWAILFFLLGQSVFAKETKLEVLKLIGSATHSGKSLMEGHVFLGKALIETGEKSYLRLRLIETDDRLVLGPSSSVQVSHLDESPPEIRSGTIRWITGNAKIKRGTVVKTPSVTFGVRGTDFYASYLPLLGESEIICFDGKVEFGTTGNGQLVGKNQWGGHGGRFGQVIAKPLDLPASVINHFKAAVPAE